MNSRQRKQRGFTLTEVLVATAIFAIIMIAALLIYDRSNVVFKGGVENSEMQQNTRVAFDKLVSDVRMAGFDFDRDGIPSGLNQYQQPDEQIEYLGNSAITIRGNLNYDTPGTQNGRETALESTQFPVVTTNNDEIVTYALVSADSTKNTGSITFYADVPNRTGYPGGSSETLVTIGGVDTTNANPPYTLQRITLAKYTNGMTAVSLVRTPLANNIRSMTFNYYEDSRATIPLRDLAGATIADSALATTVGGLGQYNPTSSVAIPAREIRKKVQAIRVTLVGMNEAIDRKYTDTTDTVAPNYRKYRLETLIIPRNAGKRGMREQDVNPPGAPTITKVCTSFCKLAYVEWQAPVIDASHGAPDDYRVMYDTTASGTGTPKPVGNTTHAFITLPNTTSNWYFNVMAVNSYGSSAHSNTVGPATVPNSTTPNAPVIAAITGGGGSNPAALPNEIVLTIAVPTPQESGTISCVVGSATGIEWPIEEVRGFQVDRKPTSVSGWGTPATETIVNESWSGWNIDYTRTAIYHDTTVYNCTNYDYRVRMVENCTGSENTGGATGVSTNSADATGQASSTVLPSQVQGVGIESTSVCTETPNQCNIGLFWLPVTTDTDGKAVQIDHYVITRKQNRTNGSTVSTATIDVRKSDSPATLSLSGGNLHWVDPGPIPAEDASGDFVYEYTVAAQQCSTPPGTASTPVKYPCNFSGGDLTIGMTGVVIEGTGSASNPWLVSPTAGLQAVTSSAVASMSAVYYPAGNPGAAVPLTPQGSFTNVSTVNWPWPDIPDGVTYRIDITALDSNGCQKKDSRYIEQTSTNCCLDPVNVTPALVTMDIASKTVWITLRSSCGERLRIAPQGVRIAWDDTKLNGNPKKLSGVYFPQHPATATTPFTLPAPSLLDTTTSNSTGTPVNASVPTGGELYIPVDDASRTNDDYVIKVIFSQQLFSNPITSICVFYQRVADDGTVIDTSNRICRIVPEPSPSENTCP